MARVYIYTLGSFTIHDEPIMVILFKEYFYYSYLGQPWRTTTGLNINNGAQSETVNATGCGFD